LNEKQFDILNDGYKMVTKTDLVSIIAAAHHQPRGAERAVRKWLENNMKINYLNLCDKNLTSYVAKTTINLHSLWRSAALQNYNTHLAYINKGTGVGE
jgi:predicted glycosyltransferase involved in capsule biosynthesis